MAEQASELVRALEGLADENEAWDWQAPVGPGNASYANGYENGRRAAGADLRALLAAYPPEKARLAAVEAVADRWEEVLAEVKVTDPRWILDRTTTTLDSALTELRRALSTPPGSGVAQ